MTDNLGYGRRSGPRDRRLRVGTDEREAVAEILRREHVAGRLDNGEFDERLERCLSAKTYSELDDLIADLPMEELESRRPTWSVGRPWPLLLLPLIAVAIVASHGHAAWLLVPLVFWFGVCRLLWGGFVRRSYALGSRRVWRG
jgi:hypothetical protein